ncbi:SNF1-interacting protein [Coemansia sp. RSA 1722]|nr:SNF1-interacting protein [Coemansia sp. RSA 1722]
MGNAAGKLNSGMVCDGGNLEPNGIYSEEQDYDTKVVQRLVLARQLAPFYVGADDPESEDCAGGDEQQQDDGWWSYNMMLAQHEQLMQQTNPSIDGDGLKSNDKSHSRQDSSTSSLGQILGEGASRASSPGTGNRSGHARKGSGFFQRLKGGTHHSKPASAGTTPGDAAPLGHASPKHSFSLSPVATRHERSFSDMSQKQAADQQQQVSAEACRMLLRRCIECPICFLPNLGIIYYPPSITTGASHSNYMKHRAQLSSQISQSSIASTTDSSMRPKTVYETGRARSHSSSTTGGGGREAVIVMSDDIRPLRVKELMAALEAKKKEQMRSAENMAMVAAATRRASARNEGRAVGRRPQRSAAASVYSGYVVAMRAAGQTDLEEFLVQEAIRMSLAEQEEGGGEGQGPSEGLRPDQSQGQDQRQSQSQDQDQDQFRSDHHDHDHDRDLAPPEPIAEVPVAEVPPMETAETAETAETTHAPNQTDNDEGSDESYLSANSIRHQPHEPTDSNAGQQPQLQPQPRTNPLHLDDTELDAIANITPRARSPVAVSPPRTPLLPPSLDDLMTFATDDAQPARTTRKPPPPPVTRHVRTSSNPFYNRTPAGSGGAVRLSDNNPFRMAAESPAVDQSASQTPTSPPPVRARRRPPPPPPPVITHGSGIRSGSRVRDRSVSAAAYTAPRPTEQN